MRLRPGPTPEAPIPPKDFFLPSAPPAPPPARPSSLPAMASSASRFPYAGSPRIASGASSEAKMRAASARTATTTRVSDSVGSRVLTRSFCRRDETEAS